MYVGPISESYILIGFLLTSIFGYFTDVYTGFIVANIVNIAFHLMQYRKTNIFDIQTFLMYIIGTILPIILIDIVTLL
jgi:hypothetical protein